MQNITAVSIPAKIYVNKAFNVTVPCDSIAGSTSDGTIAYVPQKFSIKKNGKILRTQTLSATAPSTVNNIKLTSIGYGYSLEVLFNTFRYNSGKWTPYGTHTSRNNLIVDGKITIKFNKNKGKFKKGSIKKKTVKTDGKFGTLAKLQKRKGYTFAGWYTAKKAGVKATRGSYVNLFKNTTLYAQWKYKIKFNANKGKVSKKSKKITSGKKYGTLPTPKRSGYSFKGWYTKKKGGTKITSASYVSNPSKHTLYAQWNKNSPAPTNSKYVTKAEYDKIKRGMSYAEVVKIIGGDGKFIIRVNGNPVYHWYTDKSESKFAAVNFYESPVTGSMSVNSKNNNCGW